MQTPRLSFLHHIFDDRGAVAMAPGVASNVRLQLHQELCERVPVTRLCREQEIARRLNMTTESEAAVGGGAKRLLTA